MDHVINQSGRVKSKSVESAGRRAISSSAVPSFIYCSSALPNVTSLTSPQHSQDDESNNGGIVVDKQMVSQTVTFPECLAVTALIVGKQPKAIVVGT